MAAEYGYTKEQFDGLCPREISEFMELIADRKSGYEVSATKTTTTPEQDDLIKKRMEERRAKGKIDV